MGSYRNDRLNIVDLRLEKVFTAGSTGLVSTPTWKTSSTRGRLQPGRTLPERGYFGEHRQLRRRDSSHSGAAGDVRRPLVVLAFTPS